MFAGVKTYQAELFSNSQSGNRRGGQSYIQSGAKCSETWMKCSLQYGLRQGLQ